MIDSRYWLLIGLGGVNGTPVPNLHSTASETKWLHWCKMAVFIPNMFWLHSWLKGGSGDVHLCIYIYVQQEKVPTHGRSVYKVYDLPPVGTQMSVRSVECGRSCRRLRTSIKNKHVHPSISFTARALWGGGVVGWRGLFTVNQSHGRRPRAIQRRQLTCMSSDCGRKPERTHSGTGRTRQRHTDQLAGSKPQRPLCAYRCTTVPPCEMWHSDAKNNVTFRKHTDEVVICGEGRGGGCAQLESFLPLHSAAPSVSMWRAPLPSISVHPLCMTNLHCQDTGGGEEGREEGREGEENGNLLTPQIDRVYIYICKDNQYIGNVSIHNG